MGCLNCKNSQADTPPKRNNLQYTTRHRAKYLMGNRMLYDNAATGDYNIRAADPPRPAVPLDRFVDEWTDNGLYIHEGAFVVARDSINGTRINDFMALLISPMKSPLHKYLHTRARERLNTKTEFGMNDWQFVLVYLHTCHGLSLYEIDTLYRTIHDPKRMPTFITTNTPVEQSVLPGYIAFYRTRTGDVWHTSIVVSEPADTTAEYTTLSISLGSGCVDASTEQLASDICYLSPAQVVKVIRDSLQRVRSNKRPEVDIDNIHYHEATGTVYRAIINTDSKLSRELSDAKDVYEQTLTPADIAGVDMSSLPQRYVPSQRREYATHVLCNNNATQLSRQIVGKHIAPHLPTHAY